MLSVPFGIWCHVAHRLQLGMQTLLPHTNAWEMLDYTLNHFVMVILYINKEIITICPGTRFVIRRFSEPVPDQLHGCWFPFSVMVCIESWSNSCRTGYN